VRGFSLIEVFVAMMLIITLFFAIVSMYPSSIASVRKSQDTVMAQNLARQTLETFRNVQFKDAPCDPHPPPFTLAGMASDVDTNPYVTTFPSATSPAPPGWDGGTFTILVTASFPPVGGVPAIDLVQLDVDVMWETGGETGNQVALAPSGTVANGVVHQSTVVYSVSNTW
jgi:type II secretory pathway pseudopilin PulG